MNCKETSHTSAAINLFIFTMKNQNLVNMMHELVDLHQGTCLFQTKKQEKKNR